jgi:hypothetical protein
MRLTQKCRPLLPTLPLAVAVLAWLSLATPSRAAVTCPVCKTCSYTFMVGPFTITETMMGKGKAEVEDFQHPQVPRRQTWTSVHMEGTTQFGNVSVALDQSRVSEGEIVSQGGTEFPATNTTRFFFIMTMDTPMGQKNLTSDAPVTLVAPTISSIPPDATYDLLFPVDFYEVGDPLKITVGTLTASSVTVTDGSAVVDAPFAAPATEPVALSQNYPNPFHPETVIRYEIEAPARVALRVYDLRGAMIRTLVDRQTPAGSYEVRWDGRDDAERPVSAGVYFYEIQAGESRQARRMLVLK